MSTKQVNIYECDGCGACCRHSILEVEHEDVLREPRIAEVGRLMDGRGTIPLGGACWNLNTGENAACQFIGDDNKCGIYGTRPGVCVEFQAGSDKCQMYRESAGLPPLAPRKAPADVLVRLHVLARTGKDPAPTKGAKK